MSVSLVTGGPLATVTALAWRDAGTVGGPWTVSFQPGRGAPASATFAGPQSLTESADPGVKYFSGTSTWNSGFTAPKGWHKGAALTLDLGKVGDVAEVRVNGVMVGTAWHAPYALDIGSATRPGKNLIEVRIANLWVNRLIGDKQPGATPITFTASPTYTKDAPLRPSGLLGPVTLEIEAR